MKGNKQYKDSVFTKLFSTKENALELYNAIAGTNYGSDTEIKINTLEDVLYKDRKNDLSFTIGNKSIVLFEHQSTENQNMPLRALLYLGRLYESIIDNVALYKAELIKLPAPEFYLLYNGDQALPTENTLRLTDAFVIPCDWIELKVKFININYGVSNIIEKSDTLNGYSYFIEAVKTNIRTGMNSSFAIREAVKDCISKDILTEFLDKHSSEVENMLLQEWNWDDALRVRGEESYEKGLAKGLAQGRAESTAETEKETTYRLVMAFLDDFSDEVIAQKTKLPIEDVRSIRERRDGFR